jgi:hypothetical protein
MEEIEFSEDTYGEYEYVKPLPVGSHSVLVVVSHSYCRSWAVETTMSGSSVATRLRGVRTIDGLRAYDRQYQGGSEPSLFG